MNERTYPNTADGLAQESQPSLYDLPPARTVAQAEARVAAARADMSEAWRIAREAGTRANLIRVGELIEPRLSTIERRAFNDWLATVRAAFLGAESRLKYAEARLATLRREGR